MENISFKVKLFPVGKFTFSQENVQAVLDVKDDITPLESVNIGIILAQASAAQLTANGFAWIDFIKDKNLTKHFTITEI